MKEDKPLKVSDWSQKYKLAIYAISGLGIMFGAYKIYSVLVEIRNLLDVD